VAVVRVAQGREAKTEGWEHTQKTSHFQQHFKLILNQYLMKNTLSFHFKRNIKNMGMRSHAPKSVETPLQRVPAPLHPWGGSCPGGSCLGWRLS